MINNHWLAGLIEGDGTIFIPTKGETAGFSFSEKTQYPFIRIVFHIKDKPLAQALINWLGYGTLHEVKGEKAVLWTVSKRQALEDLVGRVNGNMRTPKIHRLYKLIDWLATPNIGAKKLGLDETAIDSNAWLAGMSDADSHFNISLTKRANGAFRIQTQWRLEYSQKSYHGYDQLYWGSSISNFLNTTMYSRTRVLKTGTTQATQATQASQANKLYSSFIVVSYNKASHEKLIAYFEKFPLMSSKRLDFMDWVEAYKISLLSRQSPQEYEESVKKVQILKSSINSKRTQFNWKHLY